MKRIFENPVIEVSGYDIENVVTTSAIVTNEATTQANLEKAGVGASDINVLKFDDIITME